MNYSQHYIPPQKRYQRKSGSPGNLGIAIIPRNFNVDELKEKTGESLSQRGGQDSRRCRYSKNINNNNNSYCYTDLEKEKKETKKTQTVIKPHHGVSIKMEGNYMQMLQIENAEYLSTDDF